MSSTRTQTYVAALLSNPAFVKGALLGLDSFYKYSDMATEIAKLVDKLETAFEIPVHDSACPVCGTIEKQDESENLGP